MWSFYNTHACVVSLQHGVLTWHSGLCDLFCFALYATACLSVGTAEDPVEASEIHWTTPGKSPENLPRTSPELKEFRLFSGTRMRSVDIGPGKRLERVLRIAARAQRNRKQTNKCCLAAVCMCHSIDQNSARTLSESWRQS